MLRTALRGYDKRAVDDFLRRCVATLDRLARTVPELADVPPGRPGPMLDAGDVRAVQFPVVLRGYDVGQVDALLERVAAALPGEEARPTWPERVPRPAAAHEPLALRTTLRGYDVDEVDAFLVCCAHSLGADVARVPELAPLLQRPRAGDPLRARDVEVAQFHVRARGYDIGQVDALLDRVAAALDAGAAPGC